MHRKLDILILVTIGVLCIFQIYTYQQAESYVSDTSIYITVSENLLRHGSYEFNFKPHTLYPPAFPALLAVLGVIGGDTSYEFYMKFIPVLHALGLFVWYLLLRKEIGIFPAFAGCLLAATSAPLYRFITGGVFSDSLFFLVSGCSLFAISSLRGNTGRWASWLLWCLAAASCAVTVLTRSAGVALAAALLAWGISEGIRRKGGIQSVQRAGLVAAFAGLAAFGAWTAWSQANARSDISGHHMRSYFSQVLTADPHQPGMGQVSAGSIVLRVLDHSIIQATHIAEVFLRVTWLAPLWYSPLAWTVLILILYGAGNAIYVGEARLIGWYLLSYFVLYALWPFDEGIRFMYPVIPLAIAMMLDSFGKIAVKIRLKLRIAIIFIAPVAATLALTVWIFSPPAGLQAKAFLGFWVAVPIVILAAFMAVKMPAGWLYAVQRLFRAVQQLFRLEKARRVAEYSLVLFLAVVGIGQHVPLARANLYPDRTAFRHYPAEDSSFYLKSLPDGVVMAAQGAITHRLSGRRTVVFPITTDAAMIAGVMEQHDVKYLVVRDPVPYEYFEPNDEDRLRSLQSQYPEMLIEVHRGPGYRIFEVQAR